MIADVEDEGDKEKGEEDTKGVASVRAIEKPEEPTEEDIRSYSVAQMPFRSWCDACGKGRASSNPKQDP